MVHHLTQNLNFYRWLNDTSISSISPNDHIENLNFLDEEIKRWQDILCVDYERWITEISFQHTSQHVV